MCAYNSIFNLYLPWGKIKSIFIIRVLNGISLRIDMNLGEQYKYTVSEVLELFKEENCEVGGDKW